MGAGDGKPDDALGAYLRRDWSSCVAQLSDLGLQRRRWLDLSNTNPQWSYVEFVCNYPDDGQLIDGHVRGWLTKPQFEMMSGLRRILIAHVSPTGNDYDAATILDDPA